MNSLTFIVLGASWLTASNAFTAFCPKIASSRYPQKMFRKSKELRVLVDPINALDQISNIQHFHDALATSVYGGQDSLGITDVLSTSFLGMGQQMEIPVGTTIQPSAERMLSFTSGLSSTASNTVAPDLSGPTQVYGLPGSAQNLKPAVMDAKAKEFYAQDFDIMAKLPLATVVYVVIDFFFVNFQRVRDQEMYMYDEDSYLEETQGDSPEEITAFAGQLAFRLLMALAVVYATVFSSKITYHPHF